MLQKEDTDWVKKLWNIGWRAPDQEVDQEGRRERLCKKTAHILNGEDAMDRTGWKKLIKI